MEGLKRLAPLSLLALALVSGFLFLDLPENWGYALERRGTRIAAITIVSVAVAFSSVSFQTLTDNRILTPSIMGFEAVYFLFQTLIVFLYGDKTFQVIDQEGNFFLSILFMLGFALLLFTFLFKKGRNNMYLLLLIGLVLGTLFNTFSSFLQMVIDPNEFLTLQGRMYASFNNVNHDLLWYGAGTALVAMVIGGSNLKYLDVMALGRDNAINLGVDYFKKARLFLFLIAVLVAVSTALVGPMTFLGILVTNLTYELFKTHRHSILIPACTLVCILSLLVAQWIVERVLDFNSTVSIIINFVGGLYFMYLLFKTEKL